MDHEYNVLGGYIPSFVQHLKDTGARLGLQIGSQVSEDQTSTAGAVEEVATTHPLSSWTLAEHDAFFRALSVHSRWRPDLIATCVPTRTEWEVWMYLDALEEGAAKLAMQQGGEDVDMEDAWFHSNSDTEVDQYEPALEVSQAWIDVEERMASWIVQEEHLASVEGDAVADTEDVDDEPPKRKRGRPRGAKKGHAQSLVRERTAPDEGHHSTPPDQRSPSLESTLTSARKRETLMGRLEAPHLLVLDGILREDEEMTRERSKSRQGSVTAATPTEHTDEGVPHARGVKVSSLSHGITVPERTNDVSQSSNVVIDPTLLALSGGADPVGRQLGRVPSESAWTSGAPAHVPTQGPSSLPDVSTSSQPEMGNVFSFPLGSAALTNPNPTVNAESDLSSFSPRSRRRIQKRLYMRQKRASLRRSGAAPEGAVYMGVDKLKPGKKAQAERSRTRTVSTSMPCSEAPSDAEVKLPENVSKKNKSGLTLAYKLKAQFAEMSIDAAYLRGQGMDLLNLNALGKLMGRTFTFRLYSSLEHGEEEADGLAIAQSINAELIQHLQAAMVTFVTDIIHRAIVWKERETRLKERSRAWRHGDQITIGAVKHAVEAIGARYRSHKEYFNSLGAFHDFDNEPLSVSVNNTSELDPADDAEVEAAGPPGLSPYRDIYTPLIDPPSTWKMGPLTCLARTYEREATRTRRGTRTESDEESLMSDVTDEEALEKELKEVDKVDVGDMELAARHEEGLWDAIRRP